MKRWLAIPLLILFLYLIANIGFFVLMSLWAQFSSGSELGAGFALGFFGGGLLILWLLIKGVKWVWPSVRNKRKV